MIKNNILIKLVERIEQCFCYRDIKKIIQKSELTAEDIDRFYMDKITIRLSDARYTRKEVKSKRAYRQVISGLLRDFSWNDYTD